MGRQKHKNAMKKANWTIIRKLEKKSYDVESTIHFNPQKYCTQVDEKLQNYKTSRHQKYVQNFHIVWVTRGRCKIMFKEVRLLAKNFIESQSEIENCQILACEVMPEHIHIFVSLRHNLHPAQFVGLIRGELTTFLHKCFPILIKALGEKLFSRSFYSGTIGNVTGIGVLRYIHQQWKNYEKENYWQTKAFLEKKNSSLKEFF